MENPFKKLFSGEPSEEGDDYTKLTPTAEAMTPEERRNRITDLKKWRAEVELGMTMETHRDDAERLSMIDEKIRKLEQQ